MKMTLDEAKFWKSVYVAYIRSGQTYVSRSQSAVATQIANEAVLDLRANA